MALLPGTRLGPYEVLGPLGAGGMGEVYRARDTRLGREVAVKMVPAAFAADQERLRRFELEARAVGMLNHPNIMAIYDLGTHQGAPYVVLELLEGETLRERLQHGAVGARKAIELAAQAARGLGAAHDKGIVHRDLKPENLFVTNDGLLKILDFGLARLTRHEAESAPPGSAPTLSGDTKPGTVLGTTGYMSPEQVRGQAADHRSDIFSFGAILYEMLSGRRAFPRDTAVETMNAILNEEPPDISEVKRDVPPAAERVLRRCLEKKPEQRFQSAHDLGFALEVLSGSASAIGPAALGPRPAGRRTVMLVAAFAVIALLGAAALLGRRLGRAEPATYRQLTFRRGYLPSARFTTEGRGVIYGAAWDGRSLQLFETRPESPESRPLGLPDADILSVSPAGELAICLGRKATDWWMGRGTLARVPLAGGAPREILEDVQEASWSPDGTSLAVVHRVAGRYRLEFPIGKVLYETSGGISHLRVSPRGELVAFVDHPFAPDDTGLVSVVDLAGNKRDLTPRYNSAQGLAWAPDGKEIWYTAAESGVNCALRAVSPAGGKTRVVASIPGRLTLHDIAGDGRVLLTREDWRVGFSGRFPGETQERDLSWLDLSFATDLSADGKTVLISEQGEGGGPAYAVYLRKTDGSPAVKLGEGFGAKISPDGKWVLSMPSASRLVQLPTGVGEPRSLPSEANRSYRPVAGTAGWLPDSTRIFFAAEEAGHRVRLYVQDLGGPQARAISPEGISDSGTAVSPDGKFVAAVTTDQKLLLLPVDGGEPRPVATLSPGERLSQWSADGRWLYVAQVTEMPEKVYRLELATGRKELWKRIQATDPAGFMPTSFVNVTPNGQFYAYTYARILSELYLVEGLSRRP